ncbi:putative two-component sensor [Parvularcula bermudensis HTCC2503]|uniref:histidine kinase n=2 Tax=Parvularcula TaxID=208215 RepID=E0TFW3_PARBH|nr:putative two-component sensor [Parvularcula bermudensis HTCC2503]
MGKAGLRILLVEDDDVDAVLTQRYLKWANPYGELHRVRSVAEALEVFAPARFDVLLIDEYLGADYGTDLVRQARALDPLATLILMTGGDEADISSRALWVGADDFILKDQLSEPFLSRVLAYAVARKRTETELRRAKSEAQEGAAAKSKFIALLSHEIRTPLHGIIGMAEALGSSRLDDLQAELVGALDEASNQLLQIVNNILEQAENSAKGVSIEVEVASVPDAIETVLRVHREAAAKKGLTLTCRIRQNVPTRLIFDPLRFGQVLGNLVSNAIKFTDTGTITVTTDYDGHLLVVSVRDTGRGMPPETLETCFEPFGKATKADPDRGSGLGLSICREIIEATGGEIEAFSTQGVGTVVEVRMPVRRPPTAVNEHAQSDQRPR